MASNADEKGPDEMYCRSCGEVIKKETEICPHCGVRNEAAETDHPEQQTGGHDPSQYQTTTSDKWRFGVWVGLIFWLLLLTEPSLLDIDSGIIGLLMLIIWIGMPISAYFDMKYMRANSTWNPNTVLWVGAMFIWLINIPAGIAYLAKRGGADEVPEINE